MTWHCSCRSSMCLFTMPSWKRVCVEKRLYQSTSLKLHIKRYWGSTHRATRHTFEKSFRSDLVMFDTFTTDLRRFNVPSLHVGQELADFSRVQWFLMLGCKQDSTVLDSLWSFFAFILNSFSVFCTRSDFAQLKDHFQRI